MAAMRKSPADGVLVDTWYYDAVNVVAAPSAEDRVMDDDTPEPTAKTIVRKVAVELRLVKKYEGDKPPFATKEVGFILKCKDIALRLEGTDIESLRAAMWEKLDEKYRIDWERWLIVRVDRQGPYTGLGTGLSFGIEHVERGVAFDGSVLLRQRGWRSREETISPWPVGFKEKNGKTLACIKDTPENAKAIQEFSDRIDALRRHLAEFVKPDQIMTTLANLRAHMELALLSPPGEAD